MQTFFQIKKTTITDFKEIILSADELSCFEHIYCDFV